MVETVDSPSNGMTVHAGVTAEADFDSVEFLRWMCAKDRVNHIHYRNVRVEEPRVRYAEVFPDTGETDMFGFMRQLVRAGYARGILAEHPRALDFDRENSSTRSNQYRDVGGGGHGGELCDTGYAHAMMQAALIMEHGRMGGGRS
ncbi:mannonate dehydratase [Streptomyces sp. NPDC002596]